MERLTERKWTSKDNTQPKIELLFCANCGHEAEFHYERGMVAVWCKNCKMTTPFLESHIKATAIWNARYSVY